MHNIDMDMFRYDLQGSQIAAFPLAERDQSKLLVYRNGKIEHAIFEQLDTFLAPDMTLFFNDTRVIPARITFENETGAAIEIFLLRPFADAIPQTAMDALGEVEWTCTVGNIKRWKSGALHKKHRDGLLSAILEDRRNGTVKFSWTPGDLRFSEVLELAGSTPLPPYIKRAVEASDQIRYQTVYSASEGAVAAPTAGLHFTDKVLDRLRKRGIAMDFLTLHVSAGTFMPVKVHYAADHIMHEEQVIITRKNIDTILNAVNIIGVGTTTLRTLESLYWYGVKLSLDPRSSFKITQSDAFTLESKLSLHEAIGLVAIFMENNGLATLVGHTSIYIMPGYKFKVCSGLITNFHQPGSTLLLLIAALVGDQWRAIYREAADKNYRFLSYGDSSLLFPAGSRNGTTPFAGDLPKDCII